MFKYDVDLKHIPNENDIVPMIGQVRKLLGSHLFNLNPKVENSEQPYRDPQKGSFLSQEAFSSHLHLRNEITEIEQAKYSVDQLGHKEFRDELRVVI